MLFFFKMKKTREFGRLHNLLSRFLSIFTILYSRANKITARIFIKELSKLSRPMNEKMLIISDLALDAVGASHSERTVSGLKITESAVDDIRAMTLKINVARLDTSKKIKRTALALSAAMTELLPDDFLRSNAPVTAICIGNRSLTADSLGPLCADKLIATRHLRREASEIFSALGGREISVLRSEVASLSGIDALELSKMCVNELGSKLIITVDSLKTSSADNLYRVVQISNGITPGSGAVNDRPSISEKSLGVPVLSIGVPTSISAAALCSGIIEKTLSIAPATAKNSKPTVRQTDIAKFLDRQKRLLVTPIDSDILVNRCAQLIARAVNQALLGIDIE